MEEFTAAFLRQVTESYRHSQNNEGGKTFLNGHGSHSVAFGLRVLLKGPCCQTGFTSFRCLCTLVRQTVDSVWKESQPT